MDRNALFAVVLSGIFVLVVLYFTQPQNLSRQDYQSNINEKALEKPLPAEETLVKVPQSDVSVKARLGGRVVPAREYALTGNAEADTKQFVLNTDLLKIRFTNVDAAIAGLELLRYKDEQGQNIDAVFHKSQEVLALATSFVHADLIKTQEKSLYRYTVYKYAIQHKTLELHEAGDLEDTRKYRDVLLQKASERMQQYPHADMHQNIYFVVFRSEYALGSDGKRIEFLKIFSVFEESYALHLDVVVTKIGGGRLHVRSNDSGESDKGFYVHWGRSLGPYFDQKESSSYDQAFSSSYLDISKEHSVEELVEVNKTDIENFKWVSMDSRYLLVSLIAPWRVNERGQKIWDQKDHTAHIHQGKLVESSGLFSTSLVKERVGEELIGVSFKDFVLDDSQPSRSFDLAVFVGPKTRSLLNQSLYEDFELAVIRDRSWIPLIKPLEWAIEWFLFQSYRFTQNFGISIILLTILLKFLLNPLTKKSLESSSKMSQFAPKIKEIEKQYKNKPEQKQKAMMELYKREKINPLSGCLPLLLQAPVFYALWSVFPSLLDLKSAGFLWIKDLSSPDTVAHVDLLFTNKLNILPLIMSGTFILQSKLSPQSGIGVSGGQSAEMMKYMLPAVFLFLFWSMPSGLILYWTVQNILQIGQQFYTNWKKRTQTK